MPKHQKHDRYTQIHSLRCRHREAVKHTTTDASKSNKTNQSRAERDQQEKTLNRHVSTRRDTVKRRGVNILRLISNKFLNIVKQHRATHNSKYKTL